MPTKVVPDSTIFEAFRKWINQRPGLEPGNYFSGWHDKDGRRAFRQESRSIQKDGKEARQALEIAQAYPFDGEAMQKALDHAYSGRLQWTGTEFNYTTGQYWPTEYRQAARAVLQEYIDTVRPKSLPAKNQKFQTIQDIRCACYNAGSHWFDKGAMSFFRSKIYPHVYNGPGGIFFVSSEASGFNDETRRYSVRQFHPEDADITTLGEFTGHSTLEDARAAARKASLGGN